MAVPHIRSASPADGDVRPPSDEVELYHRTYTTLLRSSGETRLRVLEPAHRAMGSSLHGLAASEEVDLGAFIYALAACRPTSAPPRVVLGQEAEQFSRARAWADHEWERGRGAGEAAAVVRRRRGHARGPARRGSDLDDLIPTLVAYQIEWNKLHAAARAPASTPTRRRRRGVAEPLGGTEDDWAACRGLARRAATLRAEVRDRSLTCASGCSAARRSATRG